MDKRMLDEDLIVQIGFVTNDVAKSTAWFADLVGCAPGYSETVPPDARATYKGKNGKFGCKLQFFKFGNIEIEFIEPGPERSAWRDLLDEKGPGCHHIAFKTRNLTERTAYLESKGHELLQRGEFPTGGGRYAYFNTAHQLGALFELLEFDNDKEVQR